MEMAIRSNLRVLHAKKEVLIGRSIPYREISEETGLSTRSITAMFKDDMTLYAASTLSKLCAYYGCNVGDLLEYVPDKQAA
ncbi:MAG: helix-turn-helix transcriptional regulator [Anaerolineae bacterium]|nr:helix-turn-helix transcriptional regulator [Anaerolineae bacterium]